MDLEISRKNVEEELGVQRDMGGDLYPTHPSLPLVIVGLGFSCV